MLCPSTLTAFGVPSRTSFRSATLTKLELEFDIGHFLHSANTSTVVLPSAKRKAVLVADPLSLFVRMSVAYRARPTRSWYRAGCPPPSDGSGPLQRSHSSNTVRSVGKTCVLVSS